MRRPPCVRVEEELWPCARRGHDDKGHERVTSRAPGPRFEPRRPTRRGGCAASLRPARGRREAVRTSVPVEGAKGYRRLWGAGSLDFKSLGFKLRRSTTRPRRRGPASEICAGLGAAKQASRKETRRNDSTLTAERLHGTLPSCRVRPLAILAGDVAMSLETAHQSALVARSTWARRDVGRVLGSTKSRAPPMFGAPAHRRPDAYPDISECDFGRRLERRSRPSTDKEPSTRCPSPRQSSTVPSSLQSPRPHHRRRAPRELCPSKLRRFSLPHVSASGPIRAGVEDGTPPDGSTLDSDARRSAPGAKALSARGGQRLNQGAFLTRVLTI